MKKLNIETVLCALLLIALTYNIFTLFQDTRQILSKKNSAARYFAGIKFAGLNEIIGDIGHIGYYTDKDLSRKNNQAQLSQAKYILAPVILDSESLNYEYILFDCQNELNAYKKIKEINAVPFKRNPFGIIIAQKTP